MTYIIKKCPKFKLVTKPLTEEEFQNKLNELFPNETCIDNSLVKYLEKEILEIHKETVVFYNSLCNKIIMGNNELPDFILENIIGQYLEQVSYYILNLKPINMPEQDFENAKKLFFKTVKEKYTKKEGSS